MRHLHVTDFLHLLLTALLLFEKFALTADVTTITFGSHVLTQLLYGFACNDFRSNGGLDSDVKLLAWEQFFELFAHATTEVDGVVHVRERRKGIHGFAIEENVEFNEL